jgi:predicted DNA-binding transcriptional regulator AlpA
MKHPHLMDVPTIDALLADPACITTLPGPVAQHLLIRITAILPALAVQAQTASTAEKPMEDRLLQIEEAAAILQQTKDWMYRHANELPFTVREGRCLRFSANAIQKYIRTRLKQV